MGFLAPVIAGIGGVVGPTLFGTAATAGAAGAAGTAATGGLLGAGGALTLGGLANAGALGLTGMALASALNPPKPPKPPAPPKMPQPFNQGASFLGASQGTANGTFFGSAGAPSSSGSKTLLGQ